MSAPDTNIKKQEKRHFGPLFGMIAIGAATVVLMLALTYMSDDSVDDQEMTVIAPSEDAPAQSN